MAEDRVATAPWADNQRFSLVLRQRIHPPRNEKYTSERICAMTKSPDVWLPMDFPGFRGTRFGAFASESHPNRGELCRGAFAGIHSFALMGTSKRGHLCWHTASVDARAPRLRDDSGVGQGMPRVTTAYLEQSRMPQKQRASTRFCKLV